MWKTLRERVILRLDECDDGRGEGGERAWHGVEEISASTGRSYSNHDATSIESHCHSAKCVSFYGLRAIKITISLDSLLVTTIALFIRSHICFSSIVTSVTQSCR